MINYKTYALIMDIAKIAIVPLFALVILTGKIEPWGWWVSYLCGAALLALGIIIGGMVALYQVRLLAFACPDCGSQMPRSSFLADAISMRCNACRRRYSLQILDFGLASEYDAGPKL